MRLATTFGGQSKVKHRIRRIFPVFATPLSGKNAVDSYRAQIGKVWLTMPPLALEGVA